jgi:adenylate cyclase
MATGLIRRWLDTGVRDSHTAVEAAHFRSTNVFAVVCFGVGGMWALVSGVLGVVELAAIFGAGSALFLVIPLINRTGRQTLAAAALFTNIHLQLAAFQFLLGFRSGGSLSYVACVLAPYLLFTRGRRHLAHLFAVLGAVAWVGATAAQDLLPARVELLASADIELLNTALVAVALILIGVGNEVVLDEMEDSLQHERDRADGLLLNVLPPSIAERLKADPDAVIADRFDEVSILFADLVGFTPLSARLSAPRTVALLNEIFTAFDAMCDRAGVEKIRTIGDGYMAVCGAPIPQERHALVLARVAIEMRDYMASLPVDEPLEVRIGLNSGEAVAAIVGTSRFHFDLWGDAVNVAARMESLGEPGRIHIARPTWERIHAEIPCEARGPIAVKGKGEMHTWFII